MMLQDYQKPLVSIVICCYNREQYLRYTIESVLRQNYEPVEIIVMDEMRINRRIILFLRIILIILAFVKERASANADFV